MSAGNVDQAFVAALISFVAALVAAPLVMAALRKSQSVQKVSEYVPEHAAKQGTPTMGGVIVLVGVLAGMVYGGFGQFLVPAVLLLGFAIIGFVDDYVMPRTGAKIRGLGWKQKFMMQIVVAVLAYFWDGVREPWAMAFLVFVVMFFANAFNFVDGMDTLAGGVAVMLAIGFAIAARASMTDLLAEKSVLIVLASVAAGFVPFLYLNAPPAKVFMGDVCALPIGALLGWAFLEAGRPSAMVPNSYNLAALIVMSLLLVAELVPVPLQIASVKLRKGRRLFPRTPIHHAFQHAGWPETRVVWAFHLVQAVLIAVGVGMLWRFAG